MAVSLLSDCGLSFFHTHREPRPSSFFASNPFNMIYNVRTKARESKIISQVDNQIAFHPRGSLTSLPYRMNDQSTANNVNMYENKLMNSMQRPPGSRSLQLSGNSTVAVRGRARTNNRMMVFDDVWQGRIIGGKASKQGAWPWQVRLINHTKGAWPWQVRLVNHIMRSMAVAGTVNHSY